MSPEAPSKDSKASPLSKPFTYQGFFIVLLLREHCTNHFEKVFEVLLTWRTQNSLLALICIFDHLDDFLFGGLVSNN